MSSNFSASIPTAQMQAANDLLNNTAQTPGIKSYGPNNLDRAASVFLSLRRKVSGMGKLWGVESAKVVKNLVDSDVCVVPVPIFCNAHDSKPVVGMSLPSVFHVAREGHVAEIGNPVVAFDSVNVVDHLNRESSMHIQPSKAMSLKCIFADFYYAIPSGIYMSSGNDACIPASRAVRNPRKDSGFWIVVQKFFKALLSEYKMLFSHAVSPVKKWFGQRFGCVSALPFLDILTRKVA